MKVRCTSTLPNDEQAKRLGDRYLPGRQQFGVRVEGEYVVIGMNITPEGVPWVDIDLGSGYPVSVPLLLFEILDGRVSKYWELRIFDSGEVCLWPPSFYQRYYHDYLSDGRLSQVEDYSRVRKETEEEALSRS